MNDREFTQLRIAVVSQFATLPRENSAPTCSLRIAVVSQFATLIDYWEILK